MSSHEKLRLLRPLHVFESEGRSRVSATYGLGRRADETEISGLTGDAPAPGSRVSLSLLPDRIEGRHRPGGRDLPRSAFEAVHRWAADRRLVLDGVTLADWGWAAALARSPDGGANGLCAIELDEGLLQARILAVVDGVPIALRRLPAGSADSLAAALETLVGVVTRRAGRGAEDATSALALGGASFRESVRAAAATVGCRTIEATGPAADLDYSPEAVAAHYAGTGPRLVPPAVVEAAKARNRRRALWATAAATLLLVVAAAFHTLDLQRELDAVRAARAAHADQVAEVMDARQASEDLQATTADLAATVSTQPRWTTLLTSLSLGLPEGAYLTSLRATSDSLYLELQGPDAAAAFDRIRDIPTLTGFRSVAPVQRELGDANEITEHFTASATVSWADLNQPSEPAR